jgi:flagellar P-ring protein precursor FlgI
MRNMGRNAVGWVLILSLASASRAQTGAPPARENAEVTLRTVVRLGGESETPVRGIGLVTGLNGKGDGGAELTLARPLAQWYAGNGNVIPDLKDLAKGKSAAVVTLAATLPAGGVRKGDKLDVTVSVMHTATTLQGGVLAISPVLGPLPTSGVVGVASGIIHVPDPKNPTVGVIRGGLQVTEPVTMAIDSSGFDLILKPAYRGWETARTIAGVINDASATLDDDRNVAAPIAKAVDSTTVHVDVPVHERADSAGFIARIMMRRMSLGLLELEPQIICDRQSGTVVATGNVEISAVAVASKDLVVTTTVPPPVPTLADPLIKRDKWVAVQTGGRPSDRTRVQDLLNAFKQLDVSVETQIEIFERMSRSGSLHAKLVIE